MFDGVEVDWMPIIGPLLVLIATMFGVALIFKLLFSWLPKRLFNFLLGPVCLVGLYIWAIPMNLGFHEYFQ